MSDTKPTKDGFAKWRYGLWALYLISALLLVYVVVQGARSKQDQVTYKKADEIATKLDSYISRKQEIPESLSVLNISDLPSTISYTKRSSEKYTFCATYKSASGESMPSMTSPLMWLLAPSYMANYDSGSSSVRYDTSDATALYISQDHKAGQNCQTVKPYIYNSPSDWDNYYNKSSSSTGIDYNNLTQN